MSSSSIYIVTFNCARNLVDTNVFSESLLQPYDQGSDTPDIIVLSLQEIAPLAYAFLGGAYLAPYFSRFVKAVHQATGSRHPYDVITTRNVGMTGIVIMAKAELAANVQSLQTGGVGVGTVDTGNKGAVGVRIGILPKENDSTTMLTFVAAHLAPMEDAFEKRNEDWENIVRGLALEDVDKSTRSTAPDARGIEAEPLLHDGEGTSEDPKSGNGMFIPKCPVFFAGDLNYRTSDRSPTSADYASFPQPVRDRDDPRHFTHLLQHDQLSREMKRGHTLHGLSEAPIDFPPTYKLSSEEQSRRKGQGSDNFTDDAQWIWAKHRFPSWCDRILFSTAYADAITVLAYTALPIMPTSDHRPVALAFQLNHDAVAESSDETTSSPFPLNKNWQASRAYARRAELATGFVTYLAWTWEGNGIVLATALGAIGGWLAISSLLLTG